MLLIFALKYVKQASVWSLRDNWQNERHDLI